MVSDDKMPFETDVQAKQKNSVKPQSINVDQVFGFNGTDSTLLTHHGQKLWNFLLNCYIFRHISSADCILAIIFIITYKVLIFFFKWCYRFAKL